MTRKIKPTRAVDLHSPRTTIGHAVNSRRRLRSFLQKGLELAEGDILMGRHNGTKGRTAIMAHPPDKSSDLSFAQWVDAAMKGGHAIKADLKERAVIPLVTEILKSRRFPQSRLIINADVIEGPSGRKARLSLKDLLIFRREFPRAMISIGCSLPSKGSPIFDKLRVRRFKESVRKVGSPATVCLRADVALRSLPAFAELLDEHHITIWNTPATPADAKTARHFRRMVKTGLVDLMDKNGKPLF